MAVYRGRRAGTWRVVVHHRGTQLERIVEGAKREARAVERDWRAELEAGRQLGRGRVPTLAAFCAEHFGRRARAQWRPSTWRSRRYLLASLLEDLGELRLDQLDLVRVEAYKATRAEAGDAAATLNARLALLGSVLAYARRLGLRLPERSWERLPPRARRAPEAWSDADVERLLAAVRQRCAWLDRAVRLLLHTGLRKGELLALRWEDVHLRAAEPYLRVQASRDGEWSPKSVRWRDVPVDDVVRGVLRGRRASATWVLPSPRTGERYARFPDQAFGAAVRLAGLRGGPHTLRHTYATRLILATRDIYLAARILGHTAARTTELYGHLMPEHLRRAREATSAPAPS